jgi:hypothetical protein
LLTAETEDKAAGDAPISPHREAPETVNGLPLGNLRGAHKPKREKQQERSQVFGLKLSRLEPIQRNGITAHGKRTT